MLLVLLAYITININTVDSIVEILETYFTCSVGGNRSECDVHKERIEDIYRLPYFLSFFAYVMIFTINLGNLTFALHFNDVKPKLKKFCALYHC